MALRKLRFLMIADTGDQAAMQKYVGSEVREFLRRLG
jgi:hypothetical protein